MERSDPRRELRRLTCSEIRPKVLIYELMKIKMGWRISDLESHSRSMAQEHESSSVGRTRGRVGRWKFALLGVVLVVAVCLGVPAALVVNWLVKGTLEAGKGAASPTLAVQAYFLNTPIGGALAGDEVEVNLFCDGREDQLHQQTLELVKAAKRVELVDRIAFDKAEEHPSAGVEAVDGDRATYTTQANWHYLNTNPQRKAGEWLYWSSAYQDWSFELVSDNGWRVCGVTAPDPCAPSSELRCDPPPVPAATASESPA